MPEITTRAVIWDFYRTSLLLPTQSDILIALGKNIEEMDQLLVDGRVHAAFANRRAGTLSLKWTIDQNEAPSRMFKTIEKMFDQYNIYEVIAEMLQAPFYGYAVTEVIWENKDGLYIPTDLRGKAARWFGFDELNSIRMKTKVEQVQGERLPPRKFLVTRYHPRYDDPHASREALFNSLYWPVKFRHMILEYGMRFVEKYGSPWIDVSLESGLQKERLDEVLNVLQQTFANGIVAHPKNTEIKPLDMSDTKAVQNYVDWMDVMDREIDMAILGNNMSAEIKGGSFAAATTLAGVRDDIIKEDARMIETSMNQLIEWVCWYDFGTTEKLPKFKLYKSEPPTVDRANIDLMMSKLGVKLTKSYFSRTYGYNDDEFEIGQPVQTLSTGSKGNVAGAIPEGQEPREDDGTKSMQQVGQQGSDGMSSATSGAITEAGIETKDVASNEDTLAAILHAQAQGYQYAEEGIKQKDKPKMDKQESSENVKQDIEKPTRTNAYLVRHGETDLNANHVIRGWSNPKLNEKGLGDAKRVAGQLKDSKLDAIYTSDLSRASDTADAIGKSSGAKVTKMKELRPWDVGVYTGHDSDDVQALIGKYVATPDKPIPKGESFNQFRERSLSAVQDILNKHKGGNVAIVSHHRLDRLLASIDPNGEIDVQKFCQPGIAPGAMRKL
jgi:broad specificity phosphatase PhoE